jgi:hypothetical protein
VDGTGATRRQLLARAAAGTAGALAGRPAAAEAAPSGETDVELLTMLLTVEQVLGFVYGYVLASGTLSATTAASARMFLGHEQVHARALTASLQRLGGRQPQAPSDVSAAQRGLGALNVSEALTGLRTEHDSLALLVAAERGGQWVYYNAITKLRNSALALHAAEILGTEGQHAAVLAASLYDGDVKKAVPAPFVQGTH